MPVILMCFSSLVYVLRLELFSDTSFSCFSLLGFSLQTMGFLTFQPSHLEVVKEVEMEKRRFCVTLLNVGQLSRRDRRDFPQGKWGVVDILK